MNKWRIVMVEETGERVKYGNAFASFDAACDWLNQEGICEQHPECRFYVEPDILEPRCYEH